MTINQIYAGIETPDLTALTYQGVTYRCEVWRSGANRIEAEILVDGEDGQIVPILESAATIVTPGGAGTVDCPRVVAVQTEDESTFIVHWTDLGNANTIHRALFDVRNPTAGWSTPGSQPINASGAYDHATILGDATGEIIVSRHTPAGAIATARYRSPWTWLDVVWTQTDAAGLVAGTALGCHADSADDVVLVSYASALALVTLRRNASNGLGLASVETFDDLLDGDNHFTAVTHVRVGSDRYLVGAEAVPEALYSLGGTPTYLRCSAFRQIVGATAAPEYPSNFVRNVNLASRLWTWASGRPGLLEAFCAVAHKPATDGQEFDAQEVFVIRMELESLVLTGGEEPAGLVRPIPVSALIDGSIDARPHGYHPTQLFTIGSRINHLPHVTPPPAYALGPDRKTVTFAVQMWTRLMISADNADELQAAGAAAGLVRFYHEEPWMAARDTKEPTMPDLPQWRGTTQRGMCRPVDAPMGLVWTGGVTTIYDGKTLDEAGFLWNVEIMRVLAQEAGGQMDIEAEYFWYCNWYYQDRRGTIHRGPPSRVVSATVGVDGFASLRIRCLNLSVAKNDTWRDPTAPPIVIQVWRTTAVGGTPETANGLYVFRSEFGNAVDPTYAIEALPANDFDEWWIDVDVGQPNNIISLNEVAPFQLDPATLGWVPPAHRPHQPLHVATMWRDRLVGVTPEGLELIVSEPITTYGTRYVVPEFIDTAIVRLDHVGDVVALAAHDYAVWLLCRDAIFSMTGSPGAGGASADLDLQLVTRGVGCVEPRSVVITHVGVFFLSRKGLHLVDRSGNVQYPGAPVEDLVREAGTIRGAAHLDGRHEIVFALCEAPGTDPLEVRPRLLRYNYSTDRWTLDVLPRVAQAASTSRLNEVQSLAAWRGRVGGEQLLAVLQQGGLMLERGEDDTVFGDDSAAGLVAYELDVQSEWLLLADVAGSYLLKEIGIQIVWLTEGALRVEAYYDQDGTFDESEPSETWDIDAPAPAYVWLLPREQRVSAVMVRVRELDPEPTENLRLVKLLFRFAPLQRGRLAAPSATSLA